VGRSGGVVGMRSSGPVHITGTCTPTKRFTRLLFATLAYSVASSAAALRLAGKAQHVRRANHLSHKGENYHESRRND
jgi:hypothetical protein